MHPTRRPHRFPGLLLALLLTTTFADAQACDRPGTADHPLLPRYEGACLESTHAAAFDAFALPLGAVTRNADRSFSLADSSALEGAVTRLIYVVPEGRSPLEVMRNYVDGLERAGFRQAFSCAGADCGHRNGTAMLDAVFPHERRNTQDKLLINFLNQHHYAAFRKPDGSAHIAIHIGVGTSGKLKGRAVLAAVVIESEALQMRLLDATEMARSIVETGRVALRNVNFEFGSARLTADSQPVIAEMTALLRNDGGLKVFVVGHTDNVGSYEANRELSQRRAEAVVATLLEAGIEASRLTAIGVASVAPLASNRSETGRAENRRVELVER